MVSSSTDKIAVRDRVIADCEGHIANYDNLTTKTYKSEKYDLEAHCGDLEGAPIAVTKAKVPGLTKEKIQEFRANFVANISKFNKDVTFTDIGEVDGAPVRLQKIKMPMMISNRAMINVYHFVENEDGSFINVNTSQGNEDLYETYKKEVGKDVVALNRFNFQKFIPMEGGIEVHFVSCTDPQGSIPAMLKAKGSTRIMKMSERLVHYWMTGQVLDN